MSTYVCSNDINSHTHVTLSSMSATLSKLIAWRHEIISKESRERPDYTVLKTNSRP